MDPNGRSDVPQILKPTPKRPPRRENFTLTPLSTTSSNEPSPERGSDSLSANPQMSSRKPSLQNGSGSHGATTPNGSTPKTSRSFLNLTSSTLFGIYSPTGYDANRDDTQTPWGTGAQTPAIRASMDASSRGSYINADEIRKGLGISHGDDGGSSGVQRHHRPRSRGEIASALVVRALVLFAIGLLYGGIVTHLHDTRHLSPVKVPLDRGTWRYLITWGIMAVVLGALLPAVDKAWGPQMLGGRQRASSVGRSRGDSMGSYDDGQSSFSTEWNQIVRSIGAFVGIAFAIRKLPWQSTLQVSLTLSLVNPVIWYLIDRSKTGFALSTAFGITGTAALIGINPNMVPPPSIASWVSSTGAAVNASLSGADTAGNSLLSGIMSYENIGAVTWISSVLFCSCICFGNIGRRLAFGTQRP